MCDLNCKINDMVGGDHAYCGCDCHKDTFPAIEPSRERTDKKELIAMPANDVKEYSEKLEKFFGYYLETLDGENRGEYFTTERAMAEDSFDGFIIWLRESYSE